MTGDPIVAPADHHMEAALLGTLLASPPQLLADMYGIERVRPETFDRPAHREVFEAMIDVASRDDEPNAVMVAAALDRSKAPAGDPRAFVGSLLQAGTLPTDAAGYARGLKVLAASRAKFEAARDLMHAAAANSVERIAEAEGRLAVAAESSSRLATPAKRQQAIRDLAAGKGKRWRTGLGPLDRALAGGLRPGQYTTLAAWPSHGKSALVAQILRFASRQGAKCGVYTNEMEAWEMDARTIASAANVPYLALLEGGRALTADQHTSVNREIPNLGSDFALIEAAGMTAQEIAYDMQRQRWDLLALDLFNGLPGSNETKEVDFNIGVVTNATRQASCHVIACQHLSEHRHKGEKYPPMPVASDIRQSGQIYARSNNVWFVYLHEDPETGEPQLYDKDRPNDPNARFKIAKARGGVRGGFDLQFVESRLLFQDPMPLGTAGGLAA